MNAELESHKIYQKHPSLVLNSICCPPIVRNCSQATTDSFMHFTKLLQCVVFEDSKAMQGRHHVLWIRTPRGRAFNFKCKGVQKSSQNSSADCVRPNFFFRTLRTGLNRFRDESSKYESFKKRIIPIVLGSNRLSVIRFGNELSKYELFQERIL